MYYTFKNMLYDTRHILWLNSLHISYVQTYPVPINLISLHHHFKFLIYLAVLCFCSRCELVISVRLWAVWATCAIFMFFLIQSLQR